VASEGNIAGDEVHRLDSLNLLHQKWLEFTFLVADFQRILVRGVHAENFRPVNDNIFAFIREQVLLLRLVSFELRLE